MLIPRIAPTSADTVLPAPTDPSLSGATWATLASSCAAGMLGHGVVDLRPVGDGAVVAEVDHPGGALSLGPLAEVVIGVWLTRADQVVADFGQGPLRARCHAGSLFFLPAGAQLSLTVQRRHRLRLLGVQAAQVAALLADLGDGPSAARFDPLASRIFELPTTSTLVGRVWEMAARDEPAARRFLDSAITTILWDLTNAGEAGADKRPKGGLAPWQLKKVTEYILENLTADVGLEALADLLDLSPFHFCRAFKISTGQPPHRWRLHKRIALAQDLLVSTRLSIVEIAARVGYEDSTNFSSAFRRATGVTPTRYRADAGR